MGNRRQDVTLVYPQVLVRIWYTKYTIECFLHVYVSATGDKKRVPPVFGFMFDFLGL